MANRRLGGEERRGGERRASAPPSASAGTPGGPGRRGRTCPTAGTAPPCFTFPGAPGWNPPGSRTGQLVPRALRALHGAAFLLGGLNPHHLVLRVLWVNFEGLPAPPSTPPRPTYHGSKNSLICTWFSCGFHLEPPGAQHIFIWKKQTNTWTFILLHLGSGIDPKASSMLGKYSQS